MHTRLILISLIVLLMSACGEDSPQEYIASAQDAMGRSEYDAASIELKNALRIEPDSPEARWLLGKVYLETGDMPSAGKEFRRALELGGPPENIMPGLAKALLAQGEFQQVLDLNTHGLAAEPLADLQSMQAQAASAIGDTWQAEELINKAIESAPGSAPALLAKARQLAAGKDYDAANAILDDLLKRYPKDAQGWSLRGDILERQEDPRGALEAYKQSISLAPNNFDDLLKHAIVALKLGDFATAQLDATRMLSKSNKHPGANYVQGLLHFQAGRFAEAIASLTTSKKMFEFFPMAKFFLSGAYLKEGNVDLAASHAEQFHKAWPDNVPGRKLLASIRLQEGNYAAVQSLLQPVMASFPDDIDALNLMSTALMRDEKTDEAIALLTRVATLQPDSAGAQIRLGAGLLMDGEDAAAVKHIELALELDPGSEQADILLVLNSLHKGDKQAAIALAQSYLERHKNSVTAHNLLGKVYQDAGDPDQARLAFQGALAIDKADPAANHFLAQMALKKDDVASARKFYDAALAGHSDSVPTLINLAMLDAREGDDKAMLAHIEQARAADPKALAPRLILARLLLSRNKPEQVAPLFADLEASQQQSAEVLQLMAVAQLATSDPSAAQHSLEQLLKSTPDSAPIRHAMAMAAAGTGDSARAMEELRRAVALDGKHLPSRLALARLAIMTNEKEEFARQLASLDELAPNNPDVLLLRASAAQERGETAQARELAAKAFSLAPSNGTLIALANYEEAAGDRTVAQQRFADWLQQNSGDIPVRMAYAISLQAGMTPEKAADQYREVVKIDSKNLQALNNLAWLTRETEPAKALEYARVAAEIAPDSEAVLDTLAVVEYFNKDYSGAERSIAQALKVQPHNPSLLYHSAMIDVALGNETKAKAMLEKLLRAHSDFPEIAEAKALLAQLSK